jgi:hypothetical protein
VSHIPSHMRLDCVLNASRMCIITETRPTRNSIDIELLESELSDTFLVSTSAKSNDRLAMVKVGCDEEHC